MKLKQQTDYLRNRTALRFQYSSLVYDLCANNLCFLIHRILEFQNSQLRIVYKYKTKRQAKMKRRHVPEKQKFAHRP